MKVSIGVPWGSILFIFLIDNWEKDADVHHLEVLRSQSRRLWPNPRECTKYEHQ